jgi:uncharacterized protein
VPLAVIFDTNVYISGLFWRGTPYRCLYAARAELLESITCREILNEVRKKLETKFGFTAEKAQEVVDDIRSYSRNISIAGALRVVPDDPDDDKFIECAEVAGASLVVSGDRHLLKLQHYGTIEIITPASLLERLAETE